MTRHWRFQFRGRVPPLCLRVVVYYAVFAIAATLLQRRIIYQPAKLTPEDAVRIAGRNGFQPWKNPAGEIIGWHRPAPEKTGATVLVFHGNAGWAGERGYLALPISAAGRADVYVVEYPGYGARSGKPAQTTVLAAAEEACKLLADKLPLYIVSESLGAGPLSHLARLQGEKISGLMLFVPYNNFSALARRRLPILPVSLILSERYAPDRWLAEFSGPIGFVLAGQDEVVPAELGEKLFNDFTTGRKKLWRFPDAGHNDVAGQTAEWWKTVFTFWRGETNAPSGQ